MPHPKKKKKPTNHCPASCAFKMREVCHLLLLCNNINKINSTLFWTCNAFHWDTHRGNAPKASNMSCSWHDSSVYSRQKKSSVVSQMHVWNLHKNFVFIIYNSLSMIIPNTLFLGKKNKLHVLTLVLFVLLAYSCSSLREDECCSVSW